MPKTPKNIFIPGTFEQGSIYLVLWLICLFTTVLLLLSQFGKKYQQSNFTTFITDLRTTINISYKNLQRVLLHMLPNVESILNYFTLKLLKAHPRIYQIWSYTNYMIILFTLMIDVFIFEIFFYIYIGIYLYILELFVRFLSNLCGELNDAILQEVQKSIVIKTNGKVVDLCLKMML